MKTRLSITVAIALLFVALTTTDAAWSGTCSGGSNPGSQCDSDADCPGICLGGANDGAACQGPAECPKTCDRGAEVGQSCAGNVECHSLCVGGPDDGMVCTNSINCRHVCVGGDTPGAPCSGANDPSCGGACLANPSTPCTNNINCPVGDTCQQGTCSTAPYCDLATCTGECQPGTCEGTGGMGGMGGTGGTGGSGGTAGAGGGGGSSAMGDPHLHTADGLGFDLQAVGEFVLFSNAEMTLQVRQSELEGKPVSIITALAVDVRGDRIGMSLDCSALDRSALRTSYNVVPPDVDVVEPSAPVVTKSPPCPLVLRMNGQDVTLSSGEKSALVHGARFERSGLKYELASPSGETRLSINVGAFYLNLHVSASPSEGPSRGLLPAQNGDVTDDIVTRDGQVLYPPIQFRTFYQVYVESWRVKPEESLFEYGQGESTETFTDRSFPHFAMRLDYLPLTLRQSAEAVCAAAAVPPGYWFDACALDVALTGDASVAAGFVSAPQANDTLLLEQDATALAAGEEWARSAGARESGASRDLAGRGGGCRCNYLNAETHPLSLAFASGPLTFLFERRRRRRRVACPH